MTKRQNDKKTKRQKDKKGKRQKDKDRKDKDNTNRQRPKRGFNIVTSGQFRTLAMFFLNEGQYFSFSYFRSDKSLPIGQGG